MGVAPFVFEFAYNVTPFFLMGAVPVHIFIVAYMDNFVKKILEIT